jgi:hypothetical protein
MIAVAWAINPPPTAAPTMTGAGFPSVDAMVAVARVSPDMGGISYGEETRPYTRRAS